MIVKIFDRNEEYRAEAEVFNFRHLHEINRLDMLTGYTLKPIDKGEKILYQHRTGKWYEFIVDAPEIIHEEGIQYHFAAINSLVEIDGDWIEDKRPSTLSAAVVSILEPTRWTMGNVTNKPDIGLTFYRVTAREALDILLENYPVEFQTRIEVGTSGVVTRTFDILDRIGGDYGKRFVYNRDLTSVKRAYRQGKVVTALYGFGKGEEVGDGFGRRIDFSSINNGYPYVYNPAILAEYGRLENGVRKHVFDSVVYDDVDDKTKLLQLTQDEYAKRCRPQVSYEGTVVDLGLEHEKVGIGDTVKVIDGDHRFETRINYLMENEDFQDEVRLANYIMNITDSNKSLIKKVGELATNAGVWDEAQKIADGSYLDDLIGKLNDQANASGGWTFIEDGEGILTMNAPTKEQANKAVNIVGGTIRVASQKNADGTWKWRTFITGDIVVADLISTGILKGGKVHWDLDTGVLYIGDSIETANLYWDGSNLNLNFNTGITTINKDGVTVGIEGETIETNLGFDGVRIRDGATEIASFTGSGAVINNLDATSISGDVINIMSNSMTFDVGTGTGYYADFSEVLNAIGNRKHIKAGVKITINIMGVLNDSINVDGFSGGGVIEINLYNKINGYIKTSANGCKIYIYGKGNVISGSGITIDSRGDSYVLLHGLNVDSKNTASGRGVLSQEGSNVYVTECDFVNTRDALYSGSGGKIQAYNNKGNPSRYSAMGASGRVWLRGTVPDAGNFGFVYNFEAITRTPSSFSPPATTTTNETRVFNHTDIYTYSVKYGARSTHYGKAAAQNRWDTSMTQMKGRISFGTSVYNFIAGRNSGTTPTVKIRLRRQNSTHGASASVAPTPEWSGAPSFGGATRGNWTPWVTIPYTLFASSGYTFSFYNGSTGNSYAIWDYAQIQITRTITQ